MVCTQPPAWHAAYCVPVVMGSPGVHASMVWSSMYELNKKGAHEAGHSYTQTNRIVMTGLYKYLRHPQSFGWMLVFTSMAVLSLRFQILCIGILGILLVFAISKHEEMMLINRFGHDYIEYMKRVPMYNAFSATYRECSPSDSADGRNE